MVKVTIEHDGRTVVKQGEMILGGVITDTDQGHSIDAHLIGSANRRCIPELAAVLYVDAVASAFANHPFEKLGALLELRKTVEEQVKKQLNQDKDAMYEELEQWLAESEGSVQE